MASVSRFLSTGIFIYEIEFNERLILAQTMGSSGRQVLSRQIFKIEIIELIEITFLLQPDLMSSSSKMNVSSIVAFRACETL